MKSFSNYSKVLDNLRLEDYGSRDLFTCRIPVSGSVRGGGVCVGTPEPFGLIIGPGEEPPGDPPDELPEP